MATVVLVVLAGCGLPSNGSSTPPGITDGNVTDASELVRSHTNELQSQSFTVQATRTINRSNPDYRLVSRTTYKVDPGDPYRAVAETDRSVHGNTPDRLAPVPDMERWRHGESTYVRLSTTNSTRYQVVDLINSSLTTNDVTMRQTIARLIDRENATVTQVTRTGEAVTRVRASINATGLARQSTLTMVVSQSGLVRQFTATRVVNLPSGGTQTVTTEVRFSALGNTTVERPDWNDEAATETSPES